MRVLQFRADVDRIVIVENVNVGSFGGSLPLIGVALDEVGVGGGSLPRGFTECAVDRDRLLDPDGLHLGERFRNRDTTVWPLVGTRRQYRRH